MSNIYTQEDCFSLEEAVEAIILKINTAKNMFENTLIVGCIVTDVVAEQLIADLQEIAWVDHKKVGEYKHLFKIQWNNF